MDPIDLAIWHIAETKQLLEGLLHSSESFDYPTAKKHLELLQHKIRDLGKTKAQLEQLRPPPPSNVTSVAFRT